MKDKPKAGVQIPAGTVLIPTSNGNVLVGNLTESILLGTASESTPDPGKGRKVKTIILLSDLAEPITKEDP